MPTARKWRTRCCSRGRAKASFPCSNSDRSTTAFSASRSASLPGPCWRAANACRASSCCSPPSSAPASSSTQPSPAACPARTTATLPASSGLSASSACRLWARSPKGGMGAPLLRRRLAGGCGQSRPAAMPARGQALEPLCRARIKPGGHAQPTRCAVTLILLIIILILLFGGGGGYWGYRRGYYGHGGHSIVWLVVVIVVLLLLFGHGGGV